MIVAILNLLAMGGGGEAAAESVRIDAAVVHRLIQTQARTAEISGDPFMVVGPGEPDPERSDSWARLDGIELRHSVKVMAAAEPDQATLTARFHVHTRSGILDTRRTGGSSYAHAAAVMALVSAIDMQYLAAADLVHVVHLFESIVTDTGADPQKSIRTSLVELPGLAQRLSGESLEAHPQ